MHVNADRLTRLDVVQESKRARAFWNAMVRWRTADRRFVVGRNDPLAGAALRRPGRDMLTVSVPLVLFNRMEADVPGSCMNGTPGARCETTGSQGRAGRYSFHPGSVSTLLRP